MVKGQSKVHRILKIGSHNCLKGTTTKSALAIDRLLESATPKGINKPFFHRENIFVDYSGREGDVVEHSRNCTVTYTATLTIHFECTHIFKNTVTLTCT